MAEAIAPNETVADAVVVLGLKKRYKNTVALAGVSFRVSPGSVVAILGPNGAGKTTLLEILVGLRQPDQGAVSLFGNDILKHPRSCQDRIGVQLQETRLNPKMTVQEAVSLFSSFYPRLGDVPRILCELGLNDRLKQRVGKLSGGWQQRVALALSMINDPDLLILDEPTTGFDPIIRREVWGILERLRSKGRSIILSTHYMEEAERLADTIIMVSKGTIIANDTPERLKASFSETGASLEDVYARLVGEGR